MRVITMVVTLQDETPEERNSIIIAIENFAMALTQEPFVVAATVQHTGEAVSTNQDEHDV